ncbi:hypothetical protein M404DRAFT_539496 [Pisolithus tinctorius Marx 270]|uniref:Uncharacterized protein n=1 Tax=Pisolithus tinctorius Marx 270 TaxID=870435 RepID=A0A0C3PAV0_PISTI|nr:hypothetical protein M404DRAFT_539496 [Pisolithus tinctorius Marx 270]
MPGYLVCTLIPGFRMTRDPHKPTTYATFVLHSSGVGVQLLSPVCSLVPTARSSSNRILVPFRCR